MTKFDEIYKDIILDIIENGTIQEGNVRAKYADGTPAFTKYIYGVNFEIRPEDGLPILQSKRVAWKTAIREIDWIFRQMSNNVETLKYMGVNIWNEWQQDDETIGKSYGYQLGKKSIRPIAAIDGHTVHKEMNQVEYILHEIVRNPRSRRIMTSLYDVDELHDMALEPCVWTTNWSVDDKDRLHLFVKQRSADTILGLPFNVIQYSVLHRRIAQVTGKKLGSMYWTIDNAHIYDRHLELAEEQVTADISDLDGHLPILGLPKSLDYFGTPLYDAQIFNYVHNGSYKYEIAI